jgi:ABC-type lipoprotein release transport system permease subunit
MAERLFGTSTAVGRTIRDSTGPIRIVGVAEDVRHGVLREPPPWILYRSLSTRDGVQFLVQVDRDSAAVAPAIRDAARDVSHNVLNEEGSTIDVRPLVQVIEGTFVRERFLARLTATFGLLALFLAAIGIHGLIAYGVARRHREIGVRMALGAGALRVIRDVAGEIGALVTVGAFLGLFVALGTTQMISGFLFGLTPNDPWTLGTATAVLVAAAILAAAAPAWRASRIDPAIVLRHD